MTVYNKAAAKKNTSGQGPGFDGDAARHAKQSISNPYPKPVHLNALSTAAWCFLLIIV